MIGETVAHYRVEKKLGEGGMGEVYLATDLKLDRPVALKFLPEGLAGDPEARDRLVREAQAASRLNHPNILTVYAIENEGPRAFIVTEYVPGQPLSDLVAAGPLPAERVLPFLRQIAAGLRSAHEAGIVHRDIKPENVLIDTDDRARICDFGLAKMTGAGRLSGPLIAIGTAPYMSPEQTRGEPVDQRADIWALGILAHEIATGKKPFRGEYEQAVIYSILNEEPPPMECTDTALVRQLEPVIRHALQKNPDSRYQSIDELMADLDAPRAERNSTLGVVSEESDLPASSIAVLPFADMSPGRDQEYFCDGIAEQLIHDLAQVEGLHVVARTSAFAFKGKDDDVRAIGRRLSVSTVLEGSVRKADHRLRVSAQLINVADGFHLWSETYDRDAADVFAIQDDVARIIVGTLKGRLSGGEPEIGRRPTTNIKAYHQYLHGLYHWNRRTKEDLTEALGHFQSAVEHDPAFALAHVGIANVYISQQSWGQLAFDEYVRLTQVSVSEALRLDERCAEAHTARAMVLRDAGQWQEAGVSFARAVELKPGYATARQWYGIYLMDTGSPDDAHEQFTAALERDPLSLAVQTSMGWYLYLTRQFLEAIAHLEGTLEMDANFAPAHELLFWSHLSAGADSKAITHAPHWLAGLGGSPPPIDALRAAFDRTGTPGVLRLMQEFFLEQWKSGQTLVAFGLAVVASRLHEPDDALGWLERVRDARLLNVAELRFAPDYDPLRTDARFTRFLSEMTRTP